MPNTNRTQLSRNSLQRRLQQPQRFTPVRGVGQDKPLKPPAPLRTKQPAPLTKGMRPSPHTNKDNAPRRKVKTYIWMDADEKGHLERIARSKGLSVSQTGRAILVDAMRQELRVEREVLATPILEAAIKREMSVLINCLSDYLARTLLETNQMRYLFVNNLYQETLRREGAETDPQKKRQVTEKFYTLLDKSLKEAVKSIKQWNPEIKELVLSIKRFLTGEKMG